MKVAFVGHREIAKPEEVEARLTEIVTALIVDEGADTFLFGSVGNFNLMCYRVVSALKVEFPHIRRVYVRAEHDVASDDYIDYLYSMYEDTFFPDKVLNAGARSYVVRNQVMVERCDVLVTYCDAKYQPPRKTKSGTIMSVAYAMRNKKRIINLFEG